MTILSATAPLCSSWPGALTLAERRDLLRRIEDRRSAARSSPDRAREMIALWRELPGLSDDARFHALLEAQGLSPDDLETILSVPAEALAAHLDAPPGWLELASSAPPDDTPAEAEAAVVERPAHGMLRPVEPMLCEGARRLERELRRLEERGGLAPAGRAAALLEYHRVTSEHLLEMVIKPLVVEVHIARRAGVLTAPDSQGRFQEMISRLSSPAGAGTFFTHYPVLLRLCAERVHTAVDAIAELVSSVVADGPHLEGAFGPLGALTALELGLGDPHRGGKTVTRLEFERGQTILRKPRSLLIDRTYYSLLDSLSAHLGEVPFRIPSFVDRGGHGYMELIEHRPCTSRAAVERFYYRHGIHLALVYLLGGSDLHQENVIACGEHPVLVDLETLFAPELPGSPAGPARALAERVLRESVLSSGLLPQRIRITREYDRVDISGLGGAGAQDSPLELPIWHEVGLDTMHVKRARGCMPATLNLPVLDGERVTAEPFEREILAGLAAGLDVARRRRAHVSQVLTECAALPVRIVLRPTYEYAFVLGESYHPYHLGDALDRDRYFDQLWTRLSRRPCSAAIFAAEKRDLWAGDVPLFWTQPSSTSLWTSTGAEIPAAFERSGLARARARLADLSDDEVARQGWLVRTSFAGLPRWPVPRGGAHEPWLRPDPAASPLEAALAIGAVLRRQAIVAGGEATWLSVVEVEPGVLEPASAGADLYAGLPGIVLFLAYLGQISGEREHTELARAGLASLLDLLRAGEPRLASCGAFDGVVGVVYALAHLGIVLEDDALLSLADAQVERATALLGPDTPADVVSGAAGCVLGLLSLHAMRRSGPALDAAIRFGDLLLARGLGGHGGAPEREQASGAGSEQDVILSGFGHGAAGPLYSLWRLHEATADDRYRRAVQQALDLWLASRAGASRHVERDSWCRGQSGGLGALAPLIAASRDGAPGPLAPLIREARAAELSETDCLCHGELGNLDMLLSADAAWPRAPHDPAVQRRVQAVIERASSRGWTCGVPVDTVGFMDGLAGIGYELLRWSAPARVPSVLLLQPPIPRGIA